MTRRTTPRQPRRSDRVEHLDPTTEVRTDSAGILWIGPIVDGGAR